jgi:hypothetical protein
LGLKVNGLYFIPTTFKVVPTMALRQVLLYPNAGTSKEGQVEGIYASLFLSSEVRVSRYIFKTSFPRSHRSLSRLRMNWRPRSWMMDSGFVGEFTSSVSKFERTRDS